MAVAAEIERKILRIQFSGEVRPEHVKAEVERVPPLLARLGAGFVLVTDLCELEAMDLDCAPYVTQLMDLCRAAGLARVVRIIPNPRKDIGFTLLALVHYRGKIPVVICETRAEAERALDGH